MTIPRDVNVGDVLYRAEATNPAYGYVRIYHDTYRVEKVTPSGAWIRWWPSSQTNPIPTKPVGTWRSFNTRFVSLTKEEADKSFRDRKLAHFRHSLRRLHYVEDILSVLDVDVSNERRAPRVEFGWIYE